MIFQFGHAQTGTFSVSLMMDIWERGSNVKLLKQIPYWWAIVHGVHSISLGEYQQIGQKSPPSGHGHSLGKSQYIGEKSPPSELHGHSLGKSQYVGQKSPASNYGIT